MRALARDSEATDHLVAVQLIAVGPEEYELSCAEYERVVMCPAWTLGEAFGPGRHRWTCPQPQFPAVAYFVRTSPVHVPFGMSTTFVVPNRGATIRIVAQGSLHVRCIDPNDLIAQLVALPVDALNEGILRSVARSVERMLARLLARRVAMAGSAAAVTDLAELPAILAELATRNPAAGAVSGIEVMHVDKLDIAADDGTRDDEESTSQSEFPTEKLAIALPKRPVTSERAVSAAGEIVLEPQRSAGPDPAVGFPPAVVPSASPADEITRPEFALGIRAERDAIIGIGVSLIGTAAAESDSGSNGLSPGTRVLVPSATGLMQSARVRQHQRGYYEVEIDGSVDTIWVPASGVVPE